MNPNLSKSEFILLRDFIEQLCGISLGEDKAYLIENRLGELMLLNGCEDYGAFYRLAKNSPNPALREQIIDAMTTNETLWFRDNTPYVILEEVILPTLMDRVVSGSRFKIRIWSAACSTGQEPYSIAMLINDLIDNRYKGRLTPGHVEILATDISPSALRIAEKGRYNQISMSRGMREQFKTRYFQTEGPVSVISETIRRYVTFKRFNLQNSFADLGFFDLILCRNVAIYFSDAFKKDLFARFARSLNKESYFFLGSSETLRGYSEAFETLIHKGGIYHRVK